MSTTTLLIAIVSLFAGYVSNAIQTGSFLGIETVPKSWLPPLTLLGTFLVNFVQSISQASPVNTAAWEAAVLAGLASLTGVTVGVTVHQHLTVGQKAGSPPSKPVAPGVTVPDPIQAEDRKGAARMMLIVPGAFFLMLLAVQCGNAPQAVSAATDLGVLYACVEPKIGHETADQIVAECGGDAQNLIRVLLADRSKHAFCPPRATPDGG